MDKDLSNLIKLHDWEVDEKRRKLGELLRLEENLKAQALALEKEVIDEQNVAKEMPDEGGYLYGQYAETVIQRRTRIADSLQQIEQAIHDAREELRLAYLEQKKYEVAQRSRNKKIWSKQQRIDQAETDTVGLEVFRRKINQH